MIDNMENKTTHNTDIDSLKQELLRFVPEDGSSIGNKSLRERLNWDFDKYKQVRDELLRDGVIRLGRGRGGSVSYAKPLTAKELDSSPAPKKKKSHERDLYPAFFKGLQKWAADQGWTDHFVEQLAHQGRRSTGGNWTRPDFVVIGIQKYEYTPGVVRDIETFEVKPSSSGIDAVFETAAHSRFATKSHLAIQKEDEEPSEEDLARIESECQRFGLGLIVFRVPETHDDWDYKVEPIRKEPDPELLEQFVKNQVTNKEKLRMWLR